MAHLGSSNVRSMKTEIATIKLQALCSYIIIFVNTLEGKLENQILSSRKKINLWAIASAGLYVTLVHTFGYFIPFFF